MVEIRKAQSTELEMVIGFYYDLIDRIEGKEYHPKWIKGVHPSRPLLEQAIQNAQLYIGVCGQTIVSAMILNHDYASGYETVKWAVQAEDDEVSVIHVLGIHADYQGQGIAKKMIEYAFLICRENHQKALRLDVLDFNLPAQRLYTKMGFVHIDTLKMYYENTGLTDFLLYEYKID